MVHYNKKYQHVIETWPISLQVFCFICNPSFEFRMYLDDNLYLIGLDIKEVAKACRVKEYTVIKAYRDLHALAFVMIQSWYANTEDIKWLCI